ncbi:hypothetical protein [Pseudomonas sp. VI4.1]|uniref:baseplate hub protein n=1 Tax=Pseudomonas sp. VI4.1 TaxID=1941346 RepID=UPI0009D0D157|nr:hypothetical protein [Pseudomonas sp. VI4.1]OPK06123.1 hypothetical protein BZ163_33790 [Pseudomonas sp. VI4.1]
MIQKDRVYQLTIGDTNTGTGFIIDSSLQIRVRITKNADNKRSGANTATIEIYNLNPDHINMLESEYLYCKFSAGYKGVAGALVLVEGNIVECSTVKRGTDFVTELTMGEGYTDLNHVRLKQMVAPGKTNLDVIEEIRSKCPGLARGAYTGEGLNKTTMFGYPLTGSPLRALKEICEANNMEFNVSGGVLNVSDVNGLLSKNQTLAPIVSEETGLIDVPFFTSADGRMLPKDKRRRRGVQFKALLNAEYNPGYIVKIESQFITGIYRINSSLYTCDFRGNDWYVECFCSEIMAEEL